MKINNASLTGESDDLLRVVNPQGGCDTANIFEAPNVAFFGTQCTEGSGTGIVIRTGDKSVIGLIASLSQSAEKKETPLSMEIERFILLISAVAITLGVVFFLFGVAYGYDYITNLVFAIGIIVANVPEGLLATVTVSLALTAQRMAKKNVLVKNLESVETLGSTSCICSDKTGTLTQNKMTLSGMYIDRKAITCDVNMQIYNKEMDEAKPLGEDAVKQVKKPSYSLDQIGFQIMCRTIALSTVAKFEYVPDVQLLKKNYCKVNGINMKSLPDSDTWDKPLKDGGATDHMKQGIKDEEAKLQKAESAKNWNDQATKGDASETGLIKFVQPLFLSE
jgi:sodium/potassium-transporting ATPase subunit alpha